MVSYMLRITVLNLMFYICAFLFFCLQAFIKVW